MTPRLYPISLEEMGLFVAAQKVTTNEARKRFMQFVILEAIAFSPARNHLVFKGGNALRFVYHNRRSTVDLDFTAMDGFPDQEQPIRKLLDHAMRLGSERFGVKAKVQRVKRNPPGSDKHYPTYEVTIGYQFPGDRHFSDFWDSTKPLPTVVDLEISINDVVCAELAVQLDPGRESTIRVCTLEDILAEKLRSLLQQRIRNRRRKQDVYDIATMLRAYSTVVNPARISDYLLRKTLARSIDPRKSQFDEEIRSRAAFEYESLFDDQIPDFIPFDEAWAMVLSLVQKLTIPE